MTDVLRLKEQIPGPKDLVFSYFTKPSLLEKWASPKGTTLRIPEFEARIGGKYRYEHKTEEGIYVCTGYFKEFIPDQKLVHVDNIYYPDGKTVYKQLESFITFMENPSGTMVNVVMSGFDDEEIKDSCEMGWKESLENLVQLFSHYRTLPGRNLSSPTL